MEMHPSVTEQASVFPCFVFRIRRVQVDMEPLTEGIRAHLPSNDSKS